jgi:phosphonatase-like hydrolase
VNDAFRKAFLKFGYTMPAEMIAPLMGYKKTSAIEMALDKAGKEYDATLVEDIHESFTEEMVDHYYSSPEVRPAPNAESILLWLKERGVFTALNTGFPRRIADVIMERLQWVQRNLVDEYIASDDVALGRPYPQMIQSLMYACNISESSEVMKVGDTEVDIYEGRNAGCGMVVGITTGAFTREQLEIHCPDYIIDDLSELQGLIH